MATVLVMITLWVVWSVLVRWPISFEENPSDEELAERAKLHKYLQNQTDALKESYEKAKQNSPVPRSPLWVAKPTYYATYQDYLHSEEWKTKAASVRKRDAYTCQQCGKNCNLEVHHLYYEHLYNEPLSDLITVCGDCHEAIHMEHKEQPYPLLRRYAS